MSTYLNPDKGKVLRIDQIEAPSFLREYLNHELIIRNLTQRTVNSYYLHIRMFLRWLKGRHTLRIDSDFSSISIRDVPFHLIEEVTNTEILEYLAFISSTLNNGIETRSVKLTALKGMYSYFCENGRIADNPVSSIKAPKKEKLMPKYLSIDECKVLLSSINGKSADRDYCIVTLLINCGMRLSELVYIDLSHIRDDTLRIYGKGRKERILYLNDACNAALADYLHTRSEIDAIKDDNALFISSRSGKRLTPRRVQQIISNLFLKAGLAGKGYSPHKLRHTAATLMYQSGSADVLVLKELLGHANTATTEIYTHLNRKQLSEAVKTSPLSGVTRKTIHSTES